MRDGTTANDHQTSLYDSPAVCPHPDCLTTRRNLCKHDADREAGEPVGRRPKGCIAAYDPSMSEIPF